MNDTEPLERVLEATKGRGHVTAPDSEKAPKPASWKRIALNIPLIITMFKGSLPMTISLAIYQCNTIAKRFTTVGYIMAMVSFFSMAMLPRAKYLEALVLNILATCIGSALSLLAMWCGIKARQHTTIPGSNAMYNSSQAAVCGIWFFFSQWAAGTVRAKAPQLQNCVYMFSVLTMITMTYAPRFHSMDKAISLIVELLEIFFMAFGISTGVSLLIFPTTNRTILFQKQAAYFTALRGFIKKQAAYYRALKNSEHPSDIKASGREESAQKIPFAEREALCASLEGLIALHVELYTDTLNAKQEIAYGKLNGDDLQRLFSAFRRILTPMSGIKTIIDAFDRVLFEDTAGKKGGESIEATSSHRNSLRHLPNRIMSRLLDSFTDIAQIIDEGIQHAAIVLEYLPNQSGHDDIECQRPGSPTFEHYMNCKIRAFHASRSEILGAWAKERDNANLGTQTNLLDHEDLYIVIQMENLICSIAIAVHELVIFADLKSKDGTMARKRLLLPSIGQFSATQGTAATEDVTLTLDASSDYADVKELGVGEATTIQSKAKDPQHLPPRNKWERYTDHLRAIPRLMKSKESAFGLRMALAAFSVGVLAYLEKTWEFYYQQRLIWPLIVILVAMNVSSGESTFKLIAQAIGAVAAMVLSFICWYIADGKAAGVLVFTWLAFFILSYGFIKLPKYFAVWLCVLVPIIAIIGTSLQSQKLGHAVVAASGQIDYPIYLNAPYRLATVLVGSLVAYIWTVFPYPITDRSLLGEKLGDIMFLLAKYQHCGYLIATLKMKGMEGDMGLKSSRGRQLQQVQHRLFQQIMTSIPALKMHALFQRFEVPIGGAFPVRRYMIILQEVTSIMNYINLLIHSAQSWQHPLPSSAASIERSEPLLPEMTALLASVSDSSHQMTSTLTLLSSSIKHSIPLPPYFQAPPRVDFRSLWQKLRADISSGGIENRDGDELAVHSAWAMMQIVNNMTNSAIERLVVQVRELVGEVDFEMKRE